MTYQVRDCMKCGDDWCTGKQEVEALRKQVAELTQERNELLGSNVLNANAVRLQKEKVVATQARIVELRAGMLNVANGCRIWGGEAERARKMLEHYLTTTDNSSALDRRLQEERERCAKAIEPDGDECGCAAYIRSMK